MTTATVHQAWVIAVAGDRDSVDNGFIASGLGASLSAMGLRICLLKTGDWPDSGGESSTPAPRFTLRDLSTGATDLDGITQQGPTGVWLLSAADILSDFIHLGADQQTRLLTALATLESVFDCLIIEAMTGNGDRQLPLLLAASGVILVITPGAGSLTYGYALLSNLKHCYYDHPVYVIVNQAAHLPDGHAAFNRFRQAALRYLQLDPRYLGCILSDTLPSPSKDLQQSQLLHQPDAISCQCLISLSNRLNQILAHQPPPPETFSGYFGKLRNSDSVTARVTTPSVDAIERPPESDTITRQERPASAWNPLPPAFEGLRIAIHYAGLLGKTERNDR